jgi:hypothetical protein
MAGGDPKGQTLMSRDLHDAVFEGIRIDWSEAEALLTLGTHEGQHTVLIGGITDVRLSRQMPWGPSDHVNTFAEVVTDVGMHVEIELQSGDSVAIEGVSIEEADAASQQDH